MVVCFVTFPLSAANDPEAGTWQMIVLNSPAQIPVTTPAAVTDPAYLAELVPIKAAQTNDNRRSTQSNRVLEHWWY